MTDKTTPQVLTDDECEQVAGGRIPVLTTLMIGEEDGRGPIMTTMALGEEDRGELCRAPLDAKLHI